MRKIILSLILISLACSFFAQKIFAAEGAAISATIKNDVLPSEEVDPRLAKLKSFLSQFKSPLSPYAQNFIEAADRNGIDWKLLPAIAGVESTFGKNIPTGSFNAYGWNNGNYYFQSWEQSINYVSTYLKEKYYNRGLNTPWKIGPVYAPPSKTWASKVTFFMNLLGDFDNEKPLFNLDLTI